MCCLGKRIAHRGQWGSLVLAVLLTATIAAEAVAQTRKDVRIRSPGYMRRVGASRAIRDFRRYSTGIGSVYQPGGGTGGNVLRRSVSGAGIYAISRRDDRAARPDLSTGLGRGGSTGMDFRRSGGLIVPPVGGAGMGRVLLDATQTFTGTPQFRGFDNQRGILGPAPTATGAAAAYLSTSGLSPIIPAPSGSGPVRSLVPRQSSQYAEYMKAAEQAFRSGQYTQALSEYRRANELGRNDPDSLLGMFQASFARSRYSFASATYYLHRTLEVFPELPLSPLDPTAFYPDEQAYRQHLQEVEDHIKTKPGDAEAYLLVGVFRWFEGDVSAAQEALRAAVRAATSSRVLETVKAFWDGMRTSSEDIGPLEPAEEVRSGPAAVEASETPSRSE